MVKCTRFNLMYSLLSIDSFGKLSSDEMLTAGFMSLNKLGDKDKAFASTISGATSSPCG